MCLAKGACVCVCLHDDGDGWPFKGVVGHINIIYKTRKRAARRGAHGRAGNVSPAASK